MPIEYSIDPAARLVVYVVQGNATPEEAYQFLDAIVADPDFKQGFNFLGDRRDVVRGQSAGYVYGVADEIVRRKTDLAPCKWAVIVSSDHAYGMSRMWGLLTDRSGVQILPFRTAEEAVAWLGVDADHVPLRYVPASGRSVLIGA